MEPRRGVVLVHGLWLHGIAMKLLERRLAREGYRTHTLPGMRDRIVLPLSHSGMLLSARAAGQARAFLARGSFDRDRGTQR